MTTTLASDLPINTAPDPEEPLTSNGLSEVDEGKSEASFHSESDQEESAPLQCAVCSETFDTNSELSSHVANHVKLPFVRVERVSEPKPPKSRRIAKKRIRPYKNLISQVIEPEQTNGADGKYPAVPKIRILLPQQLSDQVDAENARCKSTESQRSDNSHNERVLSSLTSGSPSIHTPDMVELQTLPSESQSPAFPGPSPGQPDVAISHQPDHNSFWNQDESHASSDNSLQHHHRESGEKEAERHDSLLQNFLNDSADSVVSSKDSGMIIPNNETEFISLERLAGPQCGVCGERCVDQSALEMHYKATGHFPSVPSSCNSLVPYGGQPQTSSRSLALSNPLDSLTNLPMQQLAQQVNRLQQQGQVHQQNVLINIQQFGQPPPYGGMSPAEMGPAHMHHMPPHYSQQQPPPPPHHMYMPHSQYHPPPPPPPHHHMYYPGSGMYGPPPHPPQHSQPQQQAPQPPPNMGQQQFRHETGSMMPPRMPPPRMSQQQIRPPGQHQPQSRPAMAARGSSGNSGMGVRGSVRGMPPRVPLQPAGRGAGSSAQQQRIMLQQQHQKRTNAQQHDQQQQQIKKKRLDVLIPDTNDDADCHVISMQKCNDGLPIIKNVQGAATSTGDAMDPVVHLTDSITLSVRNPKEVIPAAQQKKNDAKAVANILATRGITVTPATKSQKETSPSPASKGNTAPVAINLNSAVSIIPTARNQQQGSPVTKTVSGGNTEKSIKPPMVDLTDDEPAGGNERKGGLAAGKRALPYQCDLCPAQYPSMRTLVIHRRQYHKAGSQNELGVPIVDLSQPASLTKLAALGIHSYIPLPQMGSGSNGTFALPIVSVNAARNPSICNIGAIGSSAVLTLGPLQHLHNLSNANKQ